MNSASTSYYEKQWHLTDLKLVVSTNTSYIYKAQYKGEVVVLKLLTEIGKKYEAPGAIALENWQQGAVKILAYDEGAHLLEYVPGNELKQVTNSGGDKLVPDIICNTLNKIHKIRQPLPEKVQSLRDSFSSLLIRGQNSDAPTYIIRGYNLALELLKSPQDEVLLHGDIHHDNIMQRASGEWVVIDPKCLWGERAYDYSNCFYDPDNNPAVVNKKDRILFYAKIFSHNLNIPLERVLKFAAAHGALSISWQMDREQEAHRRIKLLEMILELL